MKMLNLAVERLETNRYMTPDEKYRNVRVVPHLLWWVLRFSLHVSLYWVYVENKMCSTATDSTEC